MNAYEERDMNEKDEIIEILHSALETLLNKYVANRGTKGEFISCITPDKIPWYWEKAKAAANIHNIYIRDMEKKKERLENRKENKNG